MSFFKTMKCFFSTNQSGRLSKKKFVASKKKCKRKQDVLVSDPIPEVISKPEHLQDGSTISNLTEEIIDLTSNKDNSILPIKIQVLDDAQNFSPIFIHIKTGLLENIHHFNSDPSSDPVLSTAPENISNNEVAEMTILQDENTVIDKNSVDLDTMSLEKQTDPFKNDVPLLKQSDKDDVDLSIDENENIRRSDNLVINKAKKSTTCNPRKKKSKTIDKRITPQQFQFHASKVITLKEPDSYFCTLCEATLKGKKTIRSHIQNQTLYGDSGYRCHVCNEKFQWKGFLNRHVKQHFVESYVQTVVKSNKQVENKVLSSTYAESDIAELLNKASEDDHEIFNNLEQLLKSNSNSTHSSLIRIISDTNRAKINLTCSYCDQYFNTQVSLVEHCRTHIADQPFMCNICGTLFKQKSALVYHSRIHFKMIRRYKKKRNTSTFIKYILRVHSCNKCDRSYVSWSALRQHKVRAHNDLDFICDICDKGLSSMQSLRKHKSRSICKKIQENNLKLNKRTFCEICSKEYWNKISLHKHKLRKHSSV